MKPIAIITAIMLATTTLLSGFSTEEVHASEKTAFKTGDVIQFGSYLGEKLTWTVIDMDENGNPLLFADKLIGSRAYDAPNFTNKTTYTWRSKTDNYTSSVKLGGRFEWGVSALRDWLNSEESDVSKMMFAKDVNPYDNGDYNGYIKGESGFLSDKNFTTTEKDLIKPVANKSYLIQYEDYRKLKEGGNEYIELPNDVWNVFEVQKYYDNAYYRTVTDKVFVISLVEYLKAFETLGDAVRDADLLDSAQAQLKAKYNFSRPVITYQLRDPLMYENELAPSNLLMPSDKISNPTDIAAYTGAPEDPGVNIEFRHYGVRPACWLELSKITTRSGNGTKDYPYLLNNSPTDEDFYSPIKIFIDGQIVLFSKSSGAPFVDKASRTQVPLRVTMEGYGANVGWDSGTKTATVEKDGVTVKIPIGQRYIIINGERQTIDTAAQIVSNKTYLPIRPVVEALAGEVAWDQETKTVIIKQDL